MHLGAGNIQGIGDQGFGRFVDIAKLLLQSVQDRQHRAFEIEAAPNSLESDIFNSRKSSRSSWTSGVPFIACDVPHIMLSKYVFCSNYKRLSHKEEFRRRSVFAVRQRYRQAWLCVGIWASANLVLQNASA